MKKFFPYVIALTAIAISGSAAFYSVFGLGKLFAGASTQVMVMAGSLEIAKLVIASALYQYWSTIQRVLRTYLVIATCVLMIITSAGIYGYLSGAYKETIAGTKVQERELALLNTKKEVFTRQLTDLTTEKTTLNNSISQLRIAIANPGQQQYIDRRTGQVITNTSTAGRSILKTELNTTISERDKLDSKIVAINDSIAKTDIQIVEVQNSDTSTRELGPLMYLSELTGQPMDKIINWYLLLIIFVFDPLAIVLVIIANQSLSKSYNNTRITTEPIINHKEHDEEFNEHWYDIPLETSKEIHEDTEDPIETAEEINRNESHVDGTYTDKSLPKLSRQQPYY